MVCDEQFIFHCVLQQATYIFIDLLDILYLFVFFHTDTCRLLH